jgi:hypothetical protein
MNTLIGSKRSSIFLMVFALSSTAIAFVFGVFIGNTIPGPNIFSQDTLSSWVTAAATVVITLLTFILAIETWRLRAEQTTQIKNLQRESIQPSASLSLDHSPAGIHFMDIKVANTGKGIAKNIRFLFRCRDGSLATEATAPIVKPFKELAMFEYGIESLGIGQELSSFVFSFLELESEIGQDVFSPYLDILISYEDVEKHPYTNSFVVDFIQFKGMSKLADSPAENISKEIKKLRQIFENTNSSVRRLNINVYDSEDRKIEIEKQEARLAEIKRKRENPLE